MDNRNDANLDDVRADAALKRLLGAAAPPTAPTELIARTLNRLPAVPPAAAAQQQQRRAAMKRQVRLVLLGIIILAGLFNIWGVVAHGPQLAFMVGNGESGMSAVLLGLQLAAKPFWYTIRALDPLLIVGALAVASISILLTRQLVRRAQARYEVETL